MNQEKEKSKTVPKALSELLEACPVNFDPNHEQDYGTTPPPKVAFVPVILVEAILSRLRRWGI